MDIVTKCFAKDSELVTRNIAGETIIVPIKEHVGDMDSIFTLNEVGTVVWHLMDGRTSVRQIAEAVYNEYDVTEEEAKRDVIELIVSLEAAGLIHPSTESQS